MNYHHKFAQMILACFVAIPSMAATWTDPVSGITWSYAVNGGKASIYNSTTSPAISDSTSGSLTIPSNIDGYPVTTIGVGAFRACHNLTSIKVQSGVTSISKEAFYDCRSLLSVELPQGLLSIGTYAFSFCSALTGITIPSSVTSIGKYAFYQCYALSSVNIPNGVKSIEAMTFYSCRSLSSIDIPDSVNVIDSGAFEDCRGLTSIEIPNSVTTIGSSAFDWCYYLEYATIPASVSTIGYNAFYYCDSLMTIYTDIGNASRLRSLLFSANMDTDEIDIVEMEPQPDEPESDDEDGVLVSFIAPNAEVSMAKMLYTNTVYGVFPEARRDGYTFAGWYTTVDGLTRVSTFSTVDASVNALYARWVETDVTLYAQWQANAYSVTFNSNGGSGNMSDQEFLYDLRMLRNECSTFDFDTEIKGLFFCDTIKLAKVVLPGLSNYRLSTIIEELGLKDVQNSHDAVDDTLACGAVFFKMLNLSDK